ncbi:MAG: hypothetical protein ACKVHP_07805 [Verrucomicrobiales bacterium]
MRRLVILSCCLVGLFPSLENLRKAVVSNSSTQNGVALRAFSKQGASPTAANTFYMECLKKLRFTDEGKRAEAWRNYREQEDATLNSVFHRAAKQLELQYLILSIKAGGVKDRREMMAPLISFIDKLLSVDGRAYEHMDGGEGSIFTQAYKIEKTIDPGNWESDPTNIQGIYDQAILPHMRQHKDPRLVTAWRSKIDQMTKFAEARDKGREKEEREKEREERREGRGDRNDPRYRAEAKEEKDPYEDFQDETLPEMKWSMCEDLIEYGFRDDGLPMMLATIREHADYKDIHSWLDGLEVELVAALKDLGGTPPPTPSAEN